MAYEGPHPFPVKSGGSGATTLTGVLVGNGTSPFTGNAITQHDVLVGGASNAITSVAPSATAGVPLVSAGSAADPAFGTAVVAGGGTGATSFTAFSVITGGTTSTGALQNVSGVGSAGEVLTSNGAAALPTWQAAGAGTFTGTNIQVFTASGTYTPTVGMISCIVEAVGGGGGGGGVVNGSNQNGGTGGGSGGYSKDSFTAATIGASQTVTIGAAGTGVSGADGNSGGNTTFGALLTANGGAHGVVSGANATTPGGAGGTASGGSINFTGGTGGLGWQSATNFSGGAGADSPFGNGGAATMATGTGGTNGITATGNGAGGGGASNSAGSTSPRTGGSGTVGIIVVTEFI